MFDLKCFSCFKYLSSNTPNESALKNYFCLCGMCYVVTCDNKITTYNLLNDNFVVMGYALGNYTSLLERITLKSDLVVVEFINIDIKNFHIDALKVFKNLLELSIY